LNGGLEIFGHIEIRRNIFQLVNETTEMPACVNCSMTGRSGVPRGIPQRIGKLAIVVP
jgi:hypothetical protein